MVPKNTLFILHPQTNHHLTSPKAHKLVLCNGHDSVWQLANIDLDWVNCRVTSKLFRHSVHNLTLQRCMTSNMLSRLDIANCHQLARQQSNCMSTGPTQNEEMAKQSVNWYVFVHTNFFVKTSTLRLFQWRQSTELVQRIYTMAICTWSDGPQRPNRREFIALQNLGLCNWHHFVPCLDF